MDQEVIRRRNAVFSVVYSKTTRMYSTCVPKLVRWVLEVFFLAMGIATLFLWSYMHFTYIVEPEDCLREIKERPFPYDEILQVEVYTNTTDLWNKRQAFLVELYDSLSHRQSDDHSYSDAVAEEETDEISLLTNRWLSWMFSNSVEELGDDGRQMKTTVSDNSSISANSNNTENTIDALSTEHHSLYELFDVYTLKRHSIDYIILEFSQEPGYLSLTQSARTRLNITTRKLYINPENASCFGGQFGKFITKFFLGYDMMIISSFKNLLPLVQGSGYVKNLLNSNHYYYRVQWMGKWRYIVGLLPALFFTLVASVLLRQIHYNVFKFLTHFHHLLNEGVPMPIQTGAQIPFLIITYAAIGLIIVMSEAMGDDSLFSLLMVATVWEADQYYAVFCRHQISKYFFPMFFFLYHFIPYAYFIRFNGQFWFIPFTFHWLFLQHSMLFFFHRFEINRNQVQPLIMVAEVHHHRPRRNMLPPEPQQEVLPPQQELSDTENDAQNERREQRQDHTRRAEIEVGEQRQDHTRTGVRGRPVSSTVERTGHTSDGPYPRLQDNLELSTEESSQPEVGRALCVNSNNTLSQALHSAPPDSLETFSQALLHQRGIRNRVASLEVDINNLRRKRVEHFGGTSA